MLHGDCIDRLRALPDNSVHTVVCDPPYGLSKQPDMTDVLQHWLAGDDYEHKSGGFKGASWDSFVPGPRVWREVSRVLKPGGHLLAFSGARTYDLLVLAIRLAEFEVRDQVLAWTYGQGMPKYQNVSRFIDALHGHEREGTAPSITEDSKQWRGYATGLKPAQEPIVIARKPLDRRAKTVARNVLKHGTGAFNIDGCLVRSEDGCRWPPNFTLTHHPDCGPGCVRGCPVAELDRQTEDKPVSASIYLPKFAADAEEAPEQRVNGGTGSATVARATPKERADVELPIEAVMRGDDAPFRYCAKPSGKERDAGLDDWEEQSVVQWQTGNGTSGKPTGWAAAGGTVKRNIHTTVKPVELMRWLCRLVTPPDGTVLDPFAGSGTTGCAVGAENADPERAPGWSFIGIEQDPQYLQIARARIQHWARDEMLEVLDPEQNQAPDDEMLRGAEAA